MKAVIVTSIAAIALTQAANARGGLWFRDFGAGASPFVMSSSPTISVKAQATTKQKPASHRAIARSKSKSAEKRITAR
jgi:hypothetical protein